MNWENEMNVQELVADIESGALTEAVAAEASYYDQERGLNVRQQFFVYPDDTIVCMNSCDGTSSVLVLDAYNESIFRHLYPAYFYA